MTTLLFRYRLNINVFCDICVFRSPFYGGEKSLNKRPHILCPGPKYGFCTRKGTKKFVIPIEGGKLYLKAN